MKKDKNKNLLPGGVKGHDGSNAGRRPAAATIIKNRIAENVTEAENSFNYLVSVRNDKNESTALRVEAAKQILDRVIGKPMQSMDLTSKGEKLCYDIKIS